MCPKIPSDWGLRDDLLKFLDSIGNQRPFIAQKNTTPQRK